ncbi:MAG TPA: transcriptional repressor LexA [Candidatus Polarisedimenticolaceae bacterium]|nr:transcriptional repressor LexA [Candidatus Polarisedimenticolaceae bacterium]
MGRTPPGQTRQRILRFVRDRLLRGAPPTVREVQRQFGFRSVQTARQHLESLVEQGSLAKEQGKARGYRLPADETPTVLVPLLGRVPAGPSDLAVEELDDYLPIRSRRAPGELFALRVRGESMKDAGILPDDVVVVRRQKTARSGEIVVALIGDEATVKRLHIRGRRVELRPENPRFEPIVPRSGEMTLLGRVIEVRRSLE